MRETKLIIVEGIWGSGKTTTAQNIQKKLLNRGKNHELFVEGNLKHPADFDGVAYLSGNEYRELTKLFPNYVRVIGKYTEEEGGYQLVHYKKLLQENNEVNQEFTSYISQFDVYDGNLSMETHIHVVLSQWRKFVENAKVSDNIWIFECCFLQNPLTAMLAKYNATDDTIKNYIQTLAKTIEPLNPTVIYLYQTNINETFDKACQERSLEWVDGVTHYVTSQGYGKAAGLAGKSGTVAWLEKRKQLELEVLTVLPFESFIIETSDQNWSRIDIGIEQFLSL
ncbi:hypothetical protein [Peribacillus acanthi]|uniref:hypothetical protein n=1 Tax=Peribacillus acanthi TaxID=2171554 RepID=UPI000D3EC524|nr:hypothetical protein [Peribacillus acanthi]